MISIDELDYGDCDSKNNFRYFHNCQQVVFEINETTPNANSSVHCLINKNVLFLFSGGEQQWSKEQNVINNVEKT